MKSPQDIFEEWRNRRSGCLEALTTKCAAAAAVCMHPPSTCCPRCRHAAFYDQCDPDKDNLCLYGEIDGTWKVDMPAEEVPPELPEPSIGINFARDGMRVGGLACLLLDGHSTDGLCCGFRNKIGCH
jgi:hypothetical protein